VYWSLAADQPDIGPAKRATIARHNAITLLSELKEDQPTQSFAVVAPDAGIIEKKVLIYDLTENRILRRPWISARISLKDLRRKVGSNTRYVALPLLPPRKKLAVRVTIINEETKLRRSGSSAPTLKQWIAQPLPGWKKCTSKVARLQAYEEGRQLTKLVSDGVPRRHTSEKRIFLNWPAHAHCLQFAPLAHLCPECLRKINFEVVPSSKGGLGVFFADLGAKEIQVGDTICKYVVNTDFHFKAIAWHKRQGSKVAHHALAFEDKDGTAMVWDAECLGSGLGGRINVPDTSDASNCHYVSTPTGCNVVATKALGGPYCDARAELLVDSYGDGDFPHPKWSPWRLWCFTGIILEWLQLTTRSAHHLNCYNRSRSESPRQRYPCR
jgi:hypothetical protein